MNLTEIDGFIYRDSAIDDKGTVYCIFKWENEEKLAAFRKIMESNTFQEKMKYLGKFVNLSTMSNRKLQIL